MGGPHGQPRRSTIDQIEIDKLAERLFERFGGIVARLVGAERKVGAGMGERIGSEEAGNTVRDRRPVGQLLVECRESRRQIPGTGRCSIRFQNSRKRGNRSCGALPAIRLALMAPIEVPMIQSGSIAGFVQRLIDAGLIGAERPAALQNQHDLAGRGFT